MSGPPPPDVSAIKPPDAPPADLPDKRTEEEQKEFSRPSKAPTPTERMVASHAEHIGTLNQQINVRDGRCEEQTRELRDMRAELDRERAKVTALQVRCTRLEVSNSYGGCILIVGGALAFLGTVLLGVAGAAPDLTAEWKLGLVAAGGGRGRDRRVRLPHDDRRLGEG